MLENILIESLRVVKKRYKFFLFDRKLKTRQHDFKVISMGSRYGEWSFIPYDGLANCTLVSCGLGEDASFDIEFINRYEGNVIFVDPTPRAIQHFTQIVKNLGSHKKYEYSHNGSENVGSYNLESINSSQLSLVDKALWITTTKLRFYLPKNLKHISHSITNFQNNYSIDTPFILVDTIVIERLIEKFNLLKIEILKLDVEGAETFILNEMLEKSIFPNQICVEFDEMQNLNPKSKKQILECHNKLLKYNYFLVHKKNQNYLYLHSDKLHEIYKHRIN